MTSNPRKRVIYGEPPPLSRDEILRLYSLSPRSMWEQLKREHISFWLACGYLIFEYVRPQTIYPSIDILPWPTLFIIASLATSFADKNPRPRGSTISALLILYGVIILLSAIFAYRPQLAFENLSAYYNWVIIYFMIIRTVYTKAQFFLFLVLYILCNFKMTQHGFISWAQLGFAFESYGIGGSPGWFQNSGEFGIQLCIFIPLSIAFAWAVRPYCSRLFQYCLYLVSFTAFGSVIATGSRGALVGLAASGVWSLRIGKHFLRTLLILAALAGTIYFATPPEFRERFQSSGTDRTSLVRLDRWNKGWETMKANPLLGVGHKNWEQYYADNLNYGIEGTRLVHNMFIESGTEHGFLGLGALLLILVWMSIENAKTRKRAKDLGDRFTHFITHGLDAGTLGLIISSCFVTVLYYPYVWIQAAFVVALSNSLREPSRSTRTRRVTARPSKP